MSAFPAVRRTWLASLRAGPAILLLALLPSLTYLGHWETMIAYSFNGDVATSVDAAVSASGERGGGGIAEHRYGARVRAVPMREGDAAPPEADHEHALHCHANVSSCADQSSPGDLRALQFIVELPAPQFVEHALGEHQPEALEFVTAIPTEPPRL